MARHKQRGGQQPGKSPKRGHRGDSRPSRSSPTRSYLIWAAGATVVLAAAAVGWVVLKSEKPAASPASTKAADSLIADTPSVTADTSAGQNLTGTPRITFPETEHDFGIVAQGKKPSHKFVVRNTGDGPLKLIRAKGT